MIPWRMVGRISILISLLLLSVTLYLRTVNPEQARTVIILAIISSGVGVVANRIDRLRSR